MPEHEVVGVLQDLALLVSKVPRVWTLSKAGKADVLSKKPDLSGILLAMLVGQPGARAQNTDINFFYLFLERVFSTPVFRLRKIHHL